MDGQGKGEGEGVAQDGMEDKQENERYKKRQGDISTRTRKRPERVLR